MAERTHYSRAPIVEATIDLRTEQNPDLKLEALATLGEKLTADYPERGDAYVYTNSVQTDETGYPQVDHSNQQIGYAYASKDSRSVLTTNLDSFSFSVRAPYDRWETFRDEAYRLWDLYKSTASPESVTRIALRYINRLDMPESDGVNLTTYLRTYPTISSDWPGEGNMQDFFMQVRFWQEDLSCWSIINEAPESPYEEGNESIILDFDIFREELETPWGADDDSAIWDFLEQLHKRKNEFFEASITEETRRLIR